jgi:flagellar biosynthesis regulator FlbT
VFFTGVKDDEHQREDSREFISAHLNALLEHSEDVQLVSLANQVFMVNKDITYDALKTACTLLEIANGRFLF